MIIHTRGKALYHREKIKAEIYDIILRKGARLQTPMLQVKNQLRLKGLWKENMECLEMFGMFGLWNTLYYADDVRHVDFFELDGDVIKYAKKTKKGNIDFFQQDSIQYIKTTEKKYDFIFSDMPYDLDKYDPCFGIPKFTAHAIEHLNESGIFVTNMKSESIKKFKEVEKYISSISKHKILDIFFVSANGLIKKRIPTSLLCIVVE